MHVDRNRILLHVFSSSSFPSFRIYSVISVKENNGKNEFYINTNLKRIKVPDFLIYAKEDNVNNQDIIDGLNLISEYLQTNLFLPNNINFPHQRKKFIDDFKI